MRTLFIVRRPGPAPAGRGRRRIGLLAAVALVFGFLQWSVTAGPATSPARASSGISTGEGIDSCGFSTASAQAFWSGTPYYNMGLYFGGSDAACPYSSSFASAARNQGWHFMPLWVGPQSACYSGGGSLFSNDPTTAYNQGASQENSAATTLRNWGWDTTNTPIIYDLEAYNTGNSSCVTAAKQFIGGWSHEAHIAPVQQAGVYGSTCGSDLAAFVSSPTVPDFIHGADWNGNKSTGDLACVSSGSWVYHQRFKQYQGGHNETWNGYTVNVDSDCSNGPVYPSGDSASQGCA